MASRKKQRLVETLVDSLDFLEGSVVQYHLKCGRHCTCNQGRKHAKYYLSVKQDGKTRNLYLPKGAVSEARRMSRRYRRVMRLVKKISRLNYEQLKKKHVRP